MNKRLLLLPFIIFSLSACISRYASNGEHVYLQSQNGVNLIVPPPLTKASISHFYDVPAPFGNKKVSDVPPKITHHSENPVLHE